MNVQTETRSVAAAQPDFTRTAVWVLIASIGTAFAAGILLFVIARTGAGDHVVRDTLGTRRVSLPGWLWFSTLFLFTSSVAVHQSLGWMRLNLPVHARRGFRLAAGLGWAFAVFQVPGLVRLVDRYRPEHDHASLVYFLVLFLVGLHLVHAAGGLVPMTALASRAGFAASDAVERRRLESFALYWHFLAGLWLALFATFSLVR